MTIAVMDNRTRLNKTLLHHTNTSHSFPGKINHIYLSGGLLCRVGYRGAEFSSDSSSEGSLVVVSA